MRAYGTAEVSRLTHIPVRSLRALIRARYVDPAKGPRGALRFSFHDLVVLRRRAACGGGIPEVALRTRCAGFAPNSPNMPARSLR